MVVSTKVKKAFWRQSRSVRAVTQYSSLRAPFSVLCLNSILEHHIYHVFLLSDGWIDSMEIKKYYGGKLIKWSQLNQQSEVGIVPY